jgi:hypothetical protein
MEFDPLVAIGDYLLVLAGLQVTVTALVVEPPVARPECYGLGKSDGGLIQSVLS